MSNPSVKAKDSAVVAVAPTSTLLGEWDTKRDELLTVQLENLDASQTCSATVHRKVSGASGYAVSTLGDFSSIAALDSVCADLDVRGTASIRIYATMSGAGGNVRVSADRRPSI